MPSLRELQQYFAGAILAGDETAPASKCADDGVERMDLRGTERMAVYRRTITSNYRGAGLTRWLYSVLSR